MISIICIWFVDILSTSTQIVTCYQDESSFAVPTIRHRGCHYLLPCDGVVDRCESCSHLQASLNVQRMRLQESKKKAAEATSPSSHVNHRFLSNPQLISKLERTHHRLRLTVKQVVRLKSKLVEVSEQRGLSLDEKMHQGLCQIMQVETAEITKAFPPDTFKHLFWKQQQEALQKDATAMRWHPLMIRWCLYLRHRSSGAYETLRESGCLSLPSQRTLRDYTYFMKAAAGFSTEADTMLKEAAKVGKCEPREMCTLLVLDEMHIHEDLVYDKHSGVLVGFANLGDINNHLITYEQSLLESPPCEPMVHSMMVFMVRGLFSKLQFPYVQFPCAQLTGDLLFDPFWEAVYRIERLGLKVRTFISQIVQLKIS